MSWKAMSEQIKVEEKRERLLDTMTKEEILFLCEDQSLVPKETQAATVTYLKEYFARTPSYFNFAHRRMFAQAELQEAKRLVKIVQSSTLEDKDKIVAIMHNEVRRLEGILDP